MLLLAECPLGILRLFVAFPLARTDEVVTNQSIEPATALVRLIPSGGYSIQEVLSGVLFDSTSNSLYP